jgi:single-stranded-DNA-specific exonuclease
MDKKDLKWQILSTEKAETPDAIIKVLLENRGLKTKKEVDEFLNPIDPQKINLKDIGIDVGSVSKAIKRIKKAVDDNEQIVVYGDYDADGVCATAILWETLYKLTKNVAPYIPDRFKEGYGINSDSVKSLVPRYKKLKLIITVDNGIVASGGIETANDLGIDVIITDHHQKADKLPEAYSIIHTDKTSGSGVAWFFSQEIIKNFKIEKRENSLELAAIGTIADQLPLLGINRSIAKYGIGRLNKTNRPGLLALIEEAKVKRGDIGTYHINYLIAPRLNAMGRMTHAVDSLRLLCTTNQNKATELAMLVGKTNIDRQKVVEEVITHALHETGGSAVSAAIIISGEYHEGVIGLAAGKLVEVFYRPAIVMSKGVEISKASARSIAGFNIIEVIRKVEYIIEGGGGHPMAAGFSIKTNRIEEFIEAFNKEALPLLTDEIIGRKLVIDTALNFNNITEDLASKLKQFEPTGNGNYAPLFMASGVNVVESRTVGSDSKHLKLTLKQDGKVFSAIAFNFGDQITEIQKRKDLNIAFYLEENEWNGRKSLQLRIKDLK